MQPSLFCLVGTERTKKLCVFDVLNKLVSKCPWNASPHPPFMEQCGHTIEEDLAKKWKFSNIGHI